ncbi:DUF4105 domain-containing protein [Ideonella sp.]|uniref:DUF4105 domain-containing protein n=1 Tax=Ideonella sp. TaxID=1929293 RepID=UPI0037C13053
MAQQRQWQLLLNRPLEGGGSHIVDDDFFLSPVGRRDPSAELQATLLALSKPVSELDPDSHARCRFPARHLWLLSALELPSTHRPDARCRALQRWVDLDDIKSLQVILVSGYFGNPASAFGHSLIRVATHTNASSGGLTDLGINFGALVPPNENPLLYIYRGITGRYVAGFTEREFLEHDRVYSRTENRDFWTYDLKLTQAQQWLVVSHMWELVGRRFTYYFFSQNCAWRMAELLELALPQSLRRKGGDPWYIPVELVQRFSTHPDLLERLGPVQFEPSAARLLHAQIAALSDDERAEFERVIDQQTELNSALQRLSAEPAKKRLLEAVLAWAAWKDPAGSQHAQAEGKALKNQALLARLGMSVGSPKVIPTAVPSPAAGTAPMRWGLGVATGGREVSRASLTWAPVHMEAGGFNALEGGEFKMAELALSWADAQRPRQEHLTAISVLRIPLSARSLPGEQEWVWAIRLGAHRRVGAASEGEAHEPSLRSAVELGWGKGLRWGSHATAYGLAQLEASGQQVQVLPRLGLMLNLTPKWHLTADWRPACRIATAQGGCSKLEVLWRSADQQVLRWGVTAGGGQGPRAYLGLDWYQ